MMIGWGECPLGFGVRRKRRAVTKSHGCLNRQRRWPLRHVRPNAIATLQLGSALASRHAIKHSNGTMSLPNIAELSEVMAGLTLRPIVPTREPEVNVRLVPSSQGYDEKGKFERMLELGLAYSPDTKLSFDRFLDRVSKELEAKGHQAAQAFSLLVVAISLLRPGDRSDRISNLNKTVDSVRNADLILYYVSNAKLPAFYAYDIPPFRLGPLRSDKMKWNSDKAGSDFFDRYREKILGKWAIERQPMAAPVLDIPELRRVIFGGVIVLPDWRLAAWDSLVTAYFSQHNRAQFVSMWDELIDAQDTLVCMGAPYLDPRSFSAAVGGMQIAIFQRVGSSNGGYVAPASPGMIGLDLANAHERVPKAIAEMRDVYGFTAFDDSPLHGTLRLYTSFVARARRHEIEQRTSDALLHCVIALELVFGESQNIQKSVSERVAAITSRGRMESYSSERKRIEALYEARSSYVHAGVHVADDRLVADAFAVCGEAFRALLRLQSSLSEPHQRGEKALAGWLVELDYLAKGMIAGKPPTAGQLTEAYIVDG